MLDKLDLSTKAQELRESLGEDANSPVDIFSLVSQIEGLTLVFYPLGKNISGMCVKDKDIKLDDVLWTSEIFARPRVVSSLL